MPDMAEIPEVDIQRHITNLMSASQPVEKYLQQGGPLTDVQLKWIEVTITGLQALVDTWKKSMAKKRPATEVHVTAFQILEATRIPPGSSASHRKALKIALPVMPRV